MADQSPVLRDRARQYGRVLLVVIITFMLLSLYDVITTGAMLGLSVNLLLLIATPIYLYALNKAPVRELTFGYFFVQLIAIGGAVHNAGGFVSYASILYAAALLAVSFILEDTRWNIAATAMAIFSFVSLALIESFGMLAMNKPGTILLSTSGSYQIFSVAFVVIVLFGIGLIVTVIMREITLRSQEIEQANSEALQRAEQNAQLATQLEASNARLQEKETSLRQMVEDLSVTTLPIAPGVLVLPLIGVFDETRAMAVQRRVLLDLHANQTMIVIIDLTGIQLASEHFLWMLGRIINGARLLGLEVILAGVQPPFARRLIKLDFDRSQVQSVSTLAQAITLAHMAASSAKQA